MSRSRQSISKLLTSTVDTGEAERLLTTAMATSETLSGYTKDEVGLIADNMSIVNFESAQDVMREGEPGSWVGVILSGTMVVVIKETDVGTVSTGAIVGEVALWSPDSRRTATMRGKDAGVVAMLLVNELADFVTAHGRVGLKLMRQFGTAALQKIARHNSMRMAATLQPLLTFKKAEADNVQREIDAWVDQLTAHGFTREACTEVVRRCRFCRFRSGQQLMRTQHNWDGVCVVLSGTAVLENALRLGAGAFLGALQWFHERRHSNGEVRGGEAGVLAELSEEMLSELADGSHGDVGFRFVKLMGEFSVMVARATSLGNAGAAAYQGILTLSDLDPRESNAPSGSSRGNTPPGGSGGGSRAQGVGSKGVGKSVFDKNKMEVFYLSRMQAQAKEAAVLEGEMQRKTEKLQKAQLQMANAKIIMAQHTKLVDSKDAEIAKLTKRVDKLSGAQERLEQLAKAHYSLQQEASRLRERLEQSEWHGHGRDDDETLAEELKMAELKESLEASKRETAASKMREYKLIQKVRELETQLVEARDASTGTLFEAKRKAQAKVYFGLRSLLLSQLRACFLSWAQASAFIEADAHRQLAERRLKLVVVMRATSREATCAWALALWRRGVQSVLRDEAHALSLSLSLSDAKVVTQADKLQVLESLHEAALERLAGRGHTRSCRTSTIQGRPPGLTNPDSNLNLNPNPKPNPKPEPSPSPSPSPSPNANQASPRERMAVTTPTPWPRRGGCSPPG